MPVRLSLGLLLLLCSTRSPSADIELVADINIEGGGVLHPALFGEELVFAYNDGVHGTELWASDGTPAGTRLLVDVVPGVAGSEPQQLTAVGDRLFFSANDAAGRELWVFDGSAARRVADIAPDGSSAPHSLFPFDGGLFFFANDGSTGSEPWFSDGTTDGTHRIADIFSGTRSSYQGVPTATTRVFKGQIYFLADDGVHGMELWRCGSAAGSARLHADLVAGSDDAFVYPGFAATSGHLFFSATMAGANQLVATDGDATWSVASIQNSGLCVLDDQLFFMGDDGVINRELWTSDGSDVSLVKNIGPDADGEGSYHQGIGRLTRVADRLLLAGDKPGNHYDSELWISDGTTAGTVFLHDTQPGGRGTPGSPGGFVALDTERFAFLARRESYGTYHLWVGQLDGSGASEVGSLNRDGGGIDGADLYGTGKGMVFALVEYGETENELWASDGGEPVLLLGPVHGAASSEPDGITAFDGSVFFTATASSAGTGDDNLYRARVGEGATLVKNTNPGQGLFGDAKDLFLHATPYAGRLFFMGTDGDDPQQAGHGTELWATDGTAAGTGLVADLATGRSGSRLASARPSMFRVLGESLIFTAGQDGDTFNNELHIATDGGEDISLLKEIHPGGGYDGRSLAREQLVVGNGMFFTADDGSHSRELWYTDGTGPGTRLVKDIHPDGSGMPWDPVGRPPVNFGTSMVAVGEDVYFPADDGDGFDLWTSDGSTAGTRKLVDLDAVSDLVVVGDQIVFVASDAAAGKEVWISDLAGDARRLTDIAAGAAGANPQYLTAFDGQVFFSADDGVTGRELYILDPASGALIALDLDEGVGEGRPVAFVPVGPVLCFVASDGVHGRELWQSDGTAAGTRMVDDLNPGPLDSDVQFRGIESVVDGRLYFSARAPAYGQELWAYRPEATDSASRRIGIDVRPPDADYGVRIDDGEFTDLPATFEGLRRQEDHQVDFDDAGVEPGGDG